MDIGRVNMDRRHYMTNWLTPKPVCMLLIFAFSFVHSLAQNPRNCSGEVPEVMKISPRVDIGGYESIPNPGLDSTRDIFIYWEAIQSNVVNETFEDPLYYQAFHEVVGKDNITLLVESNSTYKSHAEFYGLKTTKGYNFRVYIVNKYGRSDVYTKIYVPRDTEIRFLNPLILQKRQSDDDRGFELTWKYLGNNVKQLNSFTLFWCENDEPNSPYQCNGDLKWMQFLKSESRFYFAEHDQSKSYVFAITANGQSLFDVEKGIEQNASMSSGMVWESCNFLDNKDMVMIKKIWVSDIGVNRLGVRWKLDCVDNMNLITDYVIFYCPVSFIGKLHMCQGDMKIKIISNHDIFHKKYSFSYINGLRSATSYIISIAVYTSSGYIINSITIVASTIEKEIFL